MVAVLLVLALIGLLGAEFAYSMRLEARATRNYKDAVLAGTLAEAGLENAIREIVGQGTLVAEGDDGLLTFYTTGAGRPQAAPARGGCLGSGQYSYRITDEAARINVNTRGAPARARPPAPAPGHREGGAGRHRRLDPGLARRQRRASRQRRGERRPLPEAARSLPRAQRQHRVHQRAAPDQGRHPGAVPRHRRAAGPGRFRHRRTPTGDPSTSTRRASGAVGPGPVRGRDRRDRGHAPRATLRSAVPAASRGRD